MPTAKDSLISLAGLVSGRVSPGAVPTRLWPDIIALSRPHGLAPMLLHCIHKSGVVLPGIDLSPLKEVARLNAARYVILEAAQAQIEAALRKANIAAIWIKGLALARTLYPDPALRPMLDLDVWVPYTQREVALEVAQSQGYCFPNYPGKILSANDRLLMHRVSHHYHLVGGPAQMVALEIHSRLLGISNDVLPLDEIGWFWEQTQPCRTPSIEFSTLNPTAHLLYLCAHTELQHAGLYLLRYLDLHLLITSTPPDWSMLIQRAAALCWTSVIESALRTSMELFGTSVAADVFEQLHAQRLPNEDTMRVTALKAKGSRWVRVRRLLGALSVTDQIRIVFRIVFPSPAFMRSRYAVAVGRPVWPYYLYRWLDQAREVFYAIRQRWVNWRHENEAP